MAHTHEFIRDERPGWQGGFYCRVPGCGLRIPGSMEQVARSAGARFVDDTRTTNNAEEATMTYRRAILKLARMFSGRMFTYDDPKATVPAPRARFWSDELIADTDEREEAGAIPGDYVVHDGAIWLVQQDGNEYPVPMVQAIL